MDTTFTYQNAKLDCLHLPLYMYFSIPAKIPLFPVAMPKLVNVSLIIELRAVCKFHY